MVESLQAQSPVQAYRTLEAVSAHMVHAAREGQWESLEQLRSESLAVLNRLRQSNTYQSLDKRQRLERLSILKKIVENDAQIRRITEPWSGQVAHWLGQPSAAEQLPERDRAHLTPYLMDNPLDIQAVLRQLASARVSLTLYSDRDPECFIISRLAEADARQGCLRLERAGNDQAAPSWIGDEPVTVVGFIDHIKVQFPLVSLRLAEHRGRAVFEADLPGQLYRLQRRNAYRVRPLDTHPSHCLMALPERPGQFEEVRVLDISVGGLSVAVPASLHGVHKGQILMGCFLHLPGHTAFRCDLAIRHVDETSDAQGLRRLGLDFVKLESPDERTVQVYVHAVDVAWRRLKPACS